MTTSTQTHISSGMTMLLAAAAGIIVANLYYAQPLVGPIGAALGMPPGAAGLVVTLTQIGYCLGLLFIVPLGDLVENRRLIVSGLVATGAALALAANAGAAWQFLLAALAIGLGAVVAQVLVPFAAHLAPEATRGQTVGKVVSGLLLGIMVARPVASVLAGFGGWQAVFGIAAALVLLLAVVLHFKLPQRRPAATQRYGALIASLWPVLANTVVLRRRALYHAGLFGAFSLFWTVVPQALAGPDFGLSQNGIALFALVGMAGAVASPIAGRLADNGHTLGATAIALAVGALSFTLPLFAPDSKPLALGLLALAAIALDAAVAANLVLGQRALFALGAEIRSRLNGLYFALFFAGGALGSALGGWIYAEYGWHAALVTGMLLPALALPAWLWEAAEHTANRQQA
ncbi:MULTISPECIES: MFS transporter [Massilia]|uniref:MFS transporter n=1 Tax=Massilia aurea TaxID=373040 RepID=A0A422QIL2_9BURK|nr:MULTISPECIES: MFS transporter [Massilia]MDY0961249.1 MFS transporter [Massilia sp. CFBP9026]RNF29806.1 MFS transporter [Massilia aurea]